LLSGASPRERLEALAFGAYHGGARVGYTALAIVFGELDTLV
jgi:hypothetical protein